MCMFGALSQFLQHGNAKTVTAHNLADFNNIKVVAT